MIYVYIYIFIKHIKHSPPGWGAQVKEGGGGDEVFVSKPDLYAFTRASAEGKLGLPGFWCEDRRPNCECEVAEWVAGVAVGSSGTRISAVFNMAHPRRAFWECHELRCADRKTKVDLWVGGRGGEQLSSDREGTLGSPTLLSPMPQASWTCGLAILLLLLQPS